MPTERLHLTDSLLLQFDARVLSAGTFGGKPSLVLNRTAFYAEAGGQLGDRGALISGGRSIAVRDVQIDEAGVVHHLIDAPADFAPDTPISGTIDAAHRRDSMSQHTGQHMLSRAFLDAARMETVSARLGSEDSTIDLNATIVDRDVLAKVVDRLNEVVLEDRPIRVLFPTAEELPALKLSKAPTVDREIRVIVVDGFAAMPCGGTHCQRTGQVGPVVVTGTEKIKGLTRVTFLAGQRTLRHYQRLDATLRGATSTLTCTPAELGAVLARMKDEAKTRSESLGSVQAELAKLLAMQVHAENPPKAEGDTWIFLEREGADIAVLRAFASALAKRADVVAVVSSIARESGDRIFVAERGSAARVDVGKWVKETTAAKGGRGGGRPEHAEGRVPAGAAIGV